MDSNLTTQENPTMVQNSSNQNFPKLGSVEYTLYLLDLLIFGNNSEFEQGLQALDEASQFFKTDVTNEIITIIKSDKTALLSSTGVNLFNFFFDKFFLIYEKLKTNKLHPIIAWSFWNMILNLPCIFSHEPLSDVQKVACDTWAKLPPSLVSSFLKAFQIAEIVSPKHILPKVNELIEKNSFKGAIEWIESFDLYKLIDLKGLVFMLAQKRESKLLKSIVDKFPDLLYHAIPGLKGKTTKKAINLVKNRGLNPNDFPQIGEPAQFAFMTFFCKKKNWMALEENFFGNKKMLCYVLKTLVKNNKIDEACSIIQRHNLLKDSETKNSKIIVKLSTYFTGSPQPNFNYIPNWLYIQDDFMPVEELLGEEQVGKYLNMRDFGIDPKKNLFVINNPESQTFFEAVNDLLSSSKVGLDGEFTLQTSPLEVSVLALLQLANHKNVYLFDSLHLSKFQVYQDFIERLLSNPHIQIVGHTLSSDLDKLNESRGNRSYLKIKNEIDIAKIYKKLYPQEKKFGLASICEQILKKPLSKFDQTSNWAIRPLRKAQMHYAGLDALIVLKIYEKLQEEIISRVILEMKAKFNINDLKIQINLKQPLINYQQTQSINSAVDFQGYTIENENIRQKNEVPLQTQPINSTVEFQEYKIGTENIRQKNEAPPQTQPINSAVELQKENTEIEKIPQTEVPSKVKQDFKNVVVKQEVTVGKQMKNEEIIKEIKPKDLKGLPLTQTSLIKEKKDMTAVAFEERKEIYQIFYSPMGFKWDNEKQETKKACFQQKENSIDFDSLLRPLISNNNHQRKIALDYINSLIKSKNTKLERLKDQIIQAIKSQQSSITSKNESLLKATFKKLFSLYEMSQAGDPTRTLSKFFMEIIIKLPVLNLEKSPSDIEEIALDYWNKVSLTDLKEFLKSFPIKQKTIETPKSVLFFLNKQLQSLVTIEDLTKAVELVCLFNLHECLDLESLIWKLIEQKQTDRLKLLAEKSPTLQKKAIQLLLNQGQKELAFDFLYKFQLKIEEFPDLVDFQKPFLKSIIDHIHWMSLEEKFRDSKRTLSNIVEELTQKDRIDVACSIIARHNLYDDKNYLSKTTIKKLSDYVASSHPNSLFYFPNKLFTNDDFVLSEEILEKETSSLYLSFKDFEIHISKNLIFIDNEAFESFDLAEKDLLSSEDIGLAIQQKFSMNKYENNPIATLQLAIQKKIYVFDTISLRNSPKLHALLQKIFSNPKIYLVGHSLAENIRRLKPGQSINFANKQVDISFVYRKLYFEQETISLAHICEEIFHKKMPASDEWSNWSFRPLRKAQIYYAGLNAFITLKIFEKLKEQIISRDGDINKIIQVQYNDQKKTEIPLDISFIKNQLL